MRYEKKQTVAKNGVIYIEKVVNAHGSIFHPVHQENDLGVDGFIEIVKAEESSCRLVAVQIKSGDSYFPNSGDEFAMNVDQRHLDYWLNFALPVIVIGYSPSRDMAVWVSVREHVQQQRNFYIEPVTQIRIPAHSKFDTDALSKGVAWIAVYSNVSLAMDFVDMCLSDDAQKRFDGLSALAVLPDSRYRKATCLMAHRLLMDTDVNTAKAAVHLFGFYAALNLRLWATIGPEQLQQCHFAVKLCEDLTQEEISRILEFYDDASFEGVLSRGDELVAMIAPSRDRGRGILIATAKNAANPLKRRANALYLLHQCDDVKLLSACEELRSDDELRDVVDWILSRNA